MSFKKMGNNGLKTSGRGGYDNSGVECGDITKQIINLNLTKHGETRLQFNRVK